MRPEDVFICPDCGGKYKRILGTVEQLHRGKLIKVHNVPMAQCDGDRRNGKTSCGRQPEQLSNVVSNKVFSLAKEYAEHKDETDIYYNEHYPAD